MDQVIDKMGNWPMNLDSSDIFVRQGLLVWHDTITPYFNCGDDWWWNNLVRRKTMCRRKLGSEGYGTSSLTHNSYHLHRMRGSCVETSSGNSNSSCSRRRFGQVRYSIVPRVRWSRNNRLGECSYHVYDDDTVGIIIDVTSKQIIDDRHDSIATISKA